MVGIVTTSAAVFALWFTYANWKIKELRKDEILAWSLECIEIMQRTQVLLCDFADNIVGPNYSSDFQILKMRSSVQVERGRMFFMNVPSQFGQDKPAAYRGLRPVILDCLVANYQICSLASSCETKNITTLKYLSIDYSRNFVSYVQEEVGRSRRSKSGAEAAGSPVDIEREILTYGSNRPATY
jgi:hypothetical protein